MNDIADAFYKLKIYCETEHFKGWDPYDGLNSKIFQAIPLLKKSVLCRLMVIQGFKRIKLWKIIRNYPKKWERWR